MRLTDRDRLMLQWINGHSFVTIQQAATWMKVGYETARHRLGLLVKAGYLRRKRFEHLGPLLHWLTREGGQIAGESLPAPKAINRVTYLHDTMMVDLAADFGRQRPAASSCRSAGCAPSSSPRANGP